MLYLYCLTDAPRIDLIPCRGIKEKRPFFIKWKDIAAVVSDIESREVELTAETVLLHETVVEYLCKDHTVLPVRFGSALRDVHEVKQLLEHHYNSVVENIENVKGKVELGLKVILREPLPVKMDDAPIEEPDRVSPAKAYLISKLLEEKKQQHMVEEAGKYIDEIYSALRAYAAESCIRKLTTEKMILNSAYLVLRENIDAFMLSVDWLKKKHPSLSFLCSGPWPPYNFVGLEERTQHDA